MRRRKREVKKEYIKKETRVIDKQKAGRGRERCLRLPVYVFFVSAHLFLCVSWLCCPPLPITNLSCQTHAHSIYRGIYTQMQASAHTHMQESTHTGYISKPSQENIRHLGFIRHTRKTEERREKKQARKKAPNWPNPRV